MDLRYKDGQKMNKKAQLPKADNKPKFTLFWRLFPKAWVENVLLPVTNMVLDKQLKIKEFSQFIGLIYLMLTV